MSKNDIKGTESTEQTESTERTERTEGTEENVLNEELGGETGEPGKSEEAEAPKEETAEDRLARAEARIAELEKERLYKQAEFDNYRKRIVKEKADLILNGGRKVLEAMLPVIDDLERALAHFGNTEGEAKTESTETALREGVELIYKKFLRVMEAQGVRQMETKDADFNTDFHEAVTQFPAPTDELKGKVIDCTEKGYMLNDTVLRYAKVVVGI